MTNPKVGTNSLTSLLTIRCVRPLEWSYNNRARLNKVLTRENLLNSFWWFVMTQTSFEHDQPKSWNQLLDLRFDRQMCKTLRMVLQQYGQIEQGSHTRKSFKFVLVAGHDPDII